MRDTHVIKKKSIGILNFYGRRKPDQKIEYAKIVFIKEDEIVPKTVYCSS